MALRRQGFQKDVKLIANATSEQCVAALKASAAQPADVRKLMDANLEGLSNNEKVSLELRIALRQVLISTKDVPLTDGYKRNLRHESHNLNVTEGSLVVFATFNFADTQGGNTNIEHYNSDHRLRSQSFKKGNSHIS